MRQTAWKKKLTRCESEMRNEISDRQLSLIRYFKLDWSLGLFLYHGCPPNNLVTPGYITDAQANQITCSKFAVYC